MNVMDSFRLDGKVAVLTGSAGLFGRQIADALVGAAGWEEIYVDDETFVELEKYIYVQECEPIFLKLSKELVKVFRVTGWKDKQ